MVSSERTTADGVVPGSTIDLEQPPVDPWDEVQVPAGWEAVAAIARRVSRGIDDLAMHVVTCIEAEVPAYAPGVVPLDDIHASVARTLDMILVGIAERRAPTDAELTIRRELGVRRALQGLPVDAVVAAYDIGYRELWLALVRALPPADTQATTQLLEAATTVWSWVHDVSTAMASAHAQTTRRLEARDVGARQRFVELLVAGDIDGPEAGSLGRSLGLDPGESFTVTVVRGATDDHDAVELQRRAHALAGAYAVVTRGPLVVIVAQEGVAEETIAAIRAVIPDATIATGLERLGLRGARASLTDAELTLEVTPEATTGVFDESWLWATLNGSQERLRGLLAVGVDVATKHPHLAEAVVAFGDHGFSVSEAARRLEVHANTVGYRLDRWAELTGWDPRTFAGLVRSLAAIRSA
ncbi:PucR family transcriptional regulator [Nitriliruptor alkaliphilus]|uniref:PucR family transcriptional regulator n=1 Tax=Nitriliruptor alkaliphilus TaxID=427918 RepID=UPI0006986E06|nr:helix-turn-helix domain-containing protein [Nitriliruptor alkaliphilus]